MPDPARTDYVITLAAGVTATASLWPVDDLRWSCSLIDPAGVECWRGEGPWANRDVALAQCCLQAETRWGRIVRCEPKERVERAAELEAIVRAVAESEPVDVYLHCVYCLSRNHTADCPWPRARKAMGTG